MAIVRLLGLEHLPQKQLTGTWDKAFGLGFAGMTINGQYPGSPYSAPKLEISGNKLNFGRLTTVGNSNGTGVVGIKFNTFFGEKQNVAAVNVKGWTIGFRLSKGPDIGFLNTSFSIFGLSEVAPASFSASSSVGIRLSQAGTTWQFVQTSLPAVNLSTAKDIYVEHVVTAITATTATHQIYIDGQLVYSSPQYALGIANLLSTGYLMFGMVGTVTTNGTPLDQTYAIISDVYAILDDGTAGDPYPVGSRLGPITVARVPAVAVANTDWVASDGTTPLKDVLNTRRDTDGTTNKTLLPTANSGNSATPAEVSFDVSGILDSASIAAIQVSAAVSRPTSQTANLKLSAKSGSNVEFEKSFTDLTGTGSVVQSDRSLGALQRLNGAAISKAALSDFRLALTPT